MAEVRDPSLEELLEDSRYHQVTVVFDYVSEKRRPKDPSDKLFMKMLFSDYVETEIDAENFSDSEQEIVTRTSSLFMFVLLTYLPISPPLQTILQDCMEKFKAGETDIGNLADLDLHPSYRLRNGISHIRATALLLFAYMEREESLSMIESAIKIALAGPCPKGSIPSSFLFLLNGNERDIVKNLEGNKSGPPEDLKKKILQITQKFGQKMREKAAEASLSAHPRIVLQRQEIATSNLNRANQTLDVDIQTSNQALIEILSALKPEDIKNLVLKVVDPENLEKILP